MRYHFIREYIEDGIVKIVFVKSKENDADIFTKNVSGDVYGEHFPKIVWDKRDDSTEDVGSPARKDVGR